MAAATAPDFSAIYLPLRLTYGLVPLLAGLDKFCNLLTDWSQYLPSFAAELLPIPPETFMLVVGVIETVAGLAVLTRFPRLGAAVVMVWLVLIAIVLITAGYFDIAVRDLAMAVGAYTLAQVAAWRGEPWLALHGVSRKIESHASTH